MQGSGQYVCLVNVLGQVVCRLLAHRRQSLGTAEGVHKAVNYFMSLHDCLSSSKTLFREICCVIYMTCTRICCSRGDAGVAEQVDRLVDSLKSW